MSDLFLYHDQRKSFIAVKDGLTLGRTGGDFKFSGDPLVSSLHCRFYVVGCSVYVEDLDSTNRTQVNRVPILPRRRRRVLINDVIKVGNQRLILTQQKVHQPPGSQDETMCRNVVFEPAPQSVQDLWGDHLQPEKVELEEFRTVILANAELSSELQGIPSKRNKVLVMGGSARSQSVLDSEWLSRAAFGVAAALLMSFCLF